MNYEFKYKENKTFFYNLVNKLKENKLNIDMQDLFEKTFILTVNEINFFLEEIGIEILGTSKDLNDIPKYIGMSIRKENDNTVSKDLFKNQYLSENEKLDLFLNYIKENL